MKELDRDEFIPNQNDEIRKRTQQHKEFQEFQKKRQEQIDEHAKRRGQKPGKRRFRIQFDFEYDGTVGKKMDSDSMTQPDLNLTVGQILEHHTRGTDGELVSRAPLYFETEIPTINDITDVANYRKQLNDRIMEVDKFIKKEREDAKAKEKFDAEQAAARKEAKNDSEPPKKEPKTKEKAPPKEKE